jgi:hypothetical protein
MTDRKETVTLQPATYDGLVALGDGVLSKGIEAMYESTTKRRRRAERPKARIMNMNGLHISRREAIEEQLAAMGYRMEHSLAALEGDEGHAVIEISTGDNVEPPNEQVLRLAEEWSSLEGAGNDSPRCDEASGQRVAEDAE